MRRFFQTMTSAFVALFVFFALVLPTQAEIAFEKGSLTLVTKAGKRVDFQVEWALTAEQRARGLMERESLADDAGMLFDFGETRMVTMWMANTPLSLDMVFIDEAGLVVRVAEKTTPFSEAIVGSGKPVRYALEIRGGRAAEVGLTSGARLVLPLALPAAKAP
ncbi:hypothetical protein ASE36_18290 [Rhizobium sp. Root274]|uniref:DUF192 domain-containing protein n=1 Tax=unclassified Rhizobium TaxID=2613769 RepID=UPI0007152AEA|nr:MULTISPECIES: DUF192 domain-containing protein [unclassified Rhizobium]KQW27542.1 hypothetical protein ASC71_18325 [Rhizobium sp. Root1240]KRD27780.1 hypothetical protein ASE36_18290 [Rhizobium sp. Root274]